MPAGGDQVPTMEVQACVEARSGASNDMVTPASQSSISPLLRIPKELRDEIYGYFLVMDQELVERRSLCITEGWFNLATLQINQQTRDEAWDCMIKNNLWVKVTVASINHSDNPTIGAAGHWCSVISRRPLPQWDPYSPFNTAPKEYSERLASKAAVSLWMGETRGPSDKDPVDDSSTHLTFVFAYHPHSYGVFIQELFDHASEYKGLPISPSPVTQPGSSRFSKLIEPMCIIRDLDNVWFTGLAESPTLKLLEQQMTHVQFRRGPDRDSEVLSGPGPCC
ncbi:hypothetical protein PG997_013472 [Apiospora hydei]|uniref:F-box domain-containing protein n=1 Tax=Apiospora hydei TaxID=1337664 RepID=A0ABR1V8X9_9PEZI